MMCVTWERLIASASSPPAPPIRTCRARHRRRRRPRRAGCGKRHIGKLRPQGRKLLTDPVRQGEAGAGKNGVGDELPPQKVSIPSRSRRGSWMKPDTDGEIWNQ
ncbi:MAG: hypothetical protein ACLR8P_22475 [Clostridium fessum]